RRHSGSRIHYKARRICCATDGLQRRSSHGGRESCRSAASREPQGHFGRAGLCRRDWPHRHSQTPVGRNRRSRHHRRQLHPPVRRGDILGGEEDAVLIRPATPDDVPSIRALERQTETAAHWAEREYDALFAAEAPPRITLVATSEGDAGRVIGFAIAHCANAEWEIENLVVAPEERNRGLGSKIIRELLSQAQSAGATSVLLEVRESNLAARR